METKFCYKCQTDKDRPEFAKQVRNKDGLQSMCRDCQRQYRVANRESRDAYNREYYQANKGALTEYQKQYRKDNKGYLSEYHKDKKLRDPEKYREMGRDYHERNKETRIEYVRQWRRENPDLTASYRMNRDKRLTELPFEEFKVTEIFDRDGWECGICSEPVDRSLNGNDPMGPTLDHVIPVSYNDGPNPGHVRTNVQLAHRICNIRKKDKYVPINR